MLKRGFTEEFSEKYNFCFTLFKQTAKNKIRVTSNNDG